MLKSVSLFSIVLLLAIQTIAQKNIIITIGDKKITQEEFEQIYRKNNSQLSNAEDVKTPQEYIDLFVNYKLKVIEAESRGFDTISSFIEELAGYRDELAKPYLTDVTITDSMVNEAYYRRIHEVRASHILIEVDRFALPKDTLEAYNKLIDIRNQYNNGEKTFEELAVEYSEDPSVRINKGDIGFFKVFNMVTEFENAAYTTPVGEVSMPFRTRYGYHILKVTDKFKNEGEVKVAHIMKVFSKPFDYSEEEDKAYKAEMDSLYELLQNGASFEELVRKHSTDQHTNKNDGVFRFITRTFNLEDFANAAFELENDGDFSKPVKSDYGWHIIKRLEKKPNPTFEELEEDIRYRVKRDPVRSKHSKSKFVNNLKKQYGFEEYSENIDKLKQYLLDLKTDTLPQLPQDILSLKMYQVADSVFTVKEYYDLQVKKKSDDKESFVPKIFLSHIDEYADEVVTLYEDSRLEEKHPEFKQILREYHDGMLLFSIMEQEVWNKAVQDTTGLEAYYELNKDKYFWDQRYDGMIIRCYNQETFDSCKVLIDEGLTDADSLTNLFNADNQRNIKIIKDVWEIGSNPRIDYFVFGKPKPKLNIKEFDFVHGTIIEAGQPKTLDEARGLYISDYQKVLEDKWVAELRGKYKIKVNKKLLKKVESIK